MNEEEVINEIRNGNEEAFNCLYEKYRKQIYRYIYSRVRNETEAEDLLQDTFIKVYKNINFYRKEDGNFYKFLLINAKQIVIENYRKTSRRNNKFNENITNFVELPESERLEDETINKEEKYFLNKMIDELCETHQMAIKLIYIDGLSYKRAARVMGKDENAFKAILHRAKKALYGKMIEEYPELKKDKSAGEVIKMIIIAFVCISMIGGFGYATYKVYNYVQEKSSYTLSELNEEVAEEESIITKETATNKINEYLDILGIEQEVKEDDVILVKDYLLNEICWLSINEDFKIEINSEDESLALYKDFDTDIDSSKTNVLELYEMFNFPGDYELYEDIITNNTEVIQYAKNYDGVYNEYESVTFFIIDNKLQSIYVMDYDYEDEEMLISEADAIVIAKENNIEIKDIQLKIVSIDAAENRIFDVIYEEISFHNYLSEKLNMARIKIRKVWKIITKNNETYFIDTSSGDLTKYNETSLEQKSS